MQKQNEDLYIRKEQRNQIPPLVSVDNLVVMSTNGNILDVLIVEIDQNAKRSHLFLRRMCRKQLLSGIW